MSAPTSTRAQRSAAKRDRARARLAHVGARRGSYNREQLAAAVAVRRAQLARLAPAAPPHTDENLWVPIGPTVVLNGQASGNPRVSGRVNDIWVSDDGTRAYVATANGGVWFSPDLGDTWRPLGGWAVTATPPPQQDASFVLVCGCMYVKFGATAADDEVLVGTGELTPFRSPIPINRNGGVGILRKVGPAAQPVFDEVWEIEGKNLVNLGCYRLAVDPATPDTFVVATSGSLWTRSGGPQQNWMLVSADPFNVKPAKLVCTDVVWTPAGNGVGARVWVAVVEHDGTRSGLYLSNNGLTGPFTPVTLPGVAKESRLTIAAAPSDPSVVYVLGEKNKVWRLDGATPTVTSVKNIPPNLLGGQDAYNQALAVHPTKPTRIVMGGCGEDVDGEFSAAIYLANVTGTAPNYQFGFVGTATGADAYIGHGVHADVHIARFITVSGQLELWVGCDGGVFRSQKGDADNTLVKRTFIARNTGIVSLQSGYVATHPQVDGYSLLGTQDCGTVERLGDTLWGLRFSGDGGGVAFNPLTPTRLFYQFTNAWWTDEGAKGSKFTRPVLRSTGNQKVKDGASVAEEKENGLASFYSGCDAVTVPADGTNPAFARLAFGTHRVWFSSDWGTTWHTLPSFVDPMSFSAGQNLTKDAIAMDGKAPDESRGKVRACRWMTPTRLIVLCRQMIMEYDFTPDATAKGGFKITATEITPQPPHKFLAGIPTDSPAKVLPLIDYWSDIAPHLPARGTFGSFYVAATGDPDKPGMDTLWWFDGTDTWHATTLRSDAVHGIPAPAYAVVVDPDDSNIVYVGTAVGVWKGTLTIATPKWDWVPLCNGLPEASVQDLTIVKRVGVKLLRAAVESRGVWELNLNGPGAAETFVRVHDFDTRRGSPAVLTDPKSATAQLSWHASPDVRVRPVQGSIPPKPLHLPWTDASRDPYGLWVLQTALHANAQGRVCVPNGRWTPMFSRVLQDVTNSKQVTQSIWDAQVGTGTSFPNAYATPWDGAGPTEADLYELVRDLKPPAKSPASIGVRPVTVNVDVLVHHRHLNPIDAAKVKVTLLRRDVTGTADAQWATLAGDFAPTVQNFLRNGGATPALQDNWTFADTTPASVVRNPYADVDARLPRAATFTVDLSGLAAPARVLLLAIVSSDVDPVVLATQPLQQLVLNSRFVALRSLEIV